MDNIITGVIAIGVFLAFVLGLAGSIGTIPFTVIVLIVSALILTDFIQSAKQGWKKEQKKKSSSPR